MNSTIRVMVVDDHPIVREGLRLMLATSDDLLLVGDAADGSAALQVIAEMQSDVVLLDMRIPGMSGLEVLEQIRASWPQIAVLILTTYDKDELILRGLQAGASGYLLKECPLETLFHAIRAAARGRWSCSRKLWHACSRIQTGLQTPLLHLLVRRPTLSPATWN